MEQEEPSVGQAEAEGELRPAGRFAAAATTVAVLCLALTPSVVAVAILGGGLHLFTLPVDLTAWTSALIRALQAAAIAIAVVSLLRWRRVAA